ncbi:MAG TPA: hypothetical protein ENK23_03905, partial [Sorangium sp.]|nr:hypothetical protein [Sorangium sp.]
MVGRDLTKHSQLPLRVARAASEALSETTGEPALGRLIPRRACPSTPLLLELRPEPRYTHAPMVVPVTSATQKRVLVATCFSHCMTHLYMLVFPSLVTPLRSELGLSLGDALKLTFLGY